jgi:Peptidase A4 family
MSEDDRYETYESVPEGYDLLAAKACELDCFGIPPRPTEPHLLKFWEKLVSKPFHGRKAKTGQLLASEGWQTQPPSDLESSLNWSGAMVFPPRPRRITMAVAGWIAPEVRNPSLPALFAEEDAPKTLVWVGLDGHNGRLPKISCPQIGTFHTPDVTARYQHFAWFYWWYHDPKELQIARITNLEIDPGDEILAGVWIMISGDVSLFIKNQSTGEYRCTLMKRKDLPKDIEPLGSSADWVVERPTAPRKDGKLFPLADYGTVDFKYCMALAADQPYGPCMALAADKPHEPERLMTLADNGLMIKMREAFADPYRTVYVSCAERRHYRDGSIGVTCTFHEPT